MAPMIVLIDFLTGDFRMKLVEKQMEKAMKVVICSHRRYRKRRKDKAKHQVSVTGKGSNHSVRIENKRREQAAHV